jgi:hypothetical protein
MILPLSIAEKWLLLRQGGQLPASKLSHALTTELLDEGILAARIAGRTKSTVYLDNVAAFDTWLHNKCGIADLAEYVRLLKAADASRAEQVSVVSDSKTVSHRTFRGFLVNSYMPVHCTLNGETFIVHPQPGTLLFVADFEQFIPDADVVIVGVENAENFRHIAAQQYLFDGMTTLFVSRYPQSQSKDLLKWLQAIPNHYLHFGDFDLAGINIYQHEFKKHLGSRAAFLVPPDIASLVARFGNSKLYDQQKLNAADITEPALQQLIAILHHHKKGLEQEALLIGRL